MSATDFSDPPTELDSPEEEPAFAADPPVRQNDPALVRAWVHEGLPLVQQVARQVHRQLAGRIDRSDLESAGHSALVMAAHSFDPSKGSFGAHARARLRWGMLDAVRKETHGRATAARARGLLASESLASPLREAPDPELPTSSHARTLREVAGSQALAMALCLAKNTTDEPAEGLGPERRLQAARFLEATEKAMSTLPPRQKELVYGHYFAEERFDHIAERLGVSKSWASRLHAQAMAQLAELLREHR